MHNHMPRHKRTASEHAADSTRLWKACTLQTYFTAKGLIDYFIIEDEETLLLSMLPRHECFGPDPSSMDLQLLHGLKADLQQAARDVESRAAVVHDLGDARGDRERWLVQTGFPTHLHGLRDEEIRSSFRLPRETDILPGRTPRRITIATKTAGLGTDIKDEDDGEVDLRIMLVAAEALFRKGYSLVADRSLERKMTRQRAQQLSDFASGSSKKGKDIAFYYFKNKSTLTTYFRRIKELLVYYYRVAYQQNGHFTHETEDQVLPQDVVEPTQEQRKAMDKLFEMVRELRERDGINSDDYTEKDKARLEHAVRKFYMRLICHYVGSAHFRLLVLSFCVMVSRTSAYSSKVGAGSKSRKKGHGSDDLDDIAKQRRNQGGWHNPGNYNSSLSVLVWMVQLVLSLMRRPCLVDMIENHTKNLDPQKQQGVDMIEKVRVDMVERYPHIEEGKIVDIYTIGKRIVI